jgi:outer membrane protein assembly factor BamB
MKNTKRNTVLVLTGLAFAAATCAWAQDWPQWLGPNRDGKAPGFKAPATWPKELAKKWNVPVGLGDAGPALVGDKLYVFTRDGNNEIIRCLEAATGKEVWQDKYEAQTAFSADRAHSGPRSSPAVVNGKVFTLGVGGTVSCLDASGKVLWRKNDFTAVPRFHTAMSPIVVDGLCIVELGSESSGAVVAYDVATGEQKWKYTGDGPAYASPVLVTVAGTKMIVTIAAKTIVAVGVADGKLFWQAPYAVAGMGYNAATPIVDGQTVIYCGQGRGAKAVKFEKQGDAIAANELWSNSDNSVQFNTPVLKNGLLFGQSQNGKLFCINAKDGKTAWTESAGGRTAYGTVLDAGSVLLSLSSKSQLAVFQPGDKEYTEVANYKVAEKDVYACPVLSGNRLFVKDLDSLTLWSIE